MEPHVIEQVSEILEEMQEKCVQQDVLPVCLVCCKAQVGSTRMCAFWPGDAGSPATIARMLRRAADALEEPEGK